MPDRQAQSILKTCLPPVVDDGVQLLICGSLPGDASLREARYYAHPRNHFWRLLETVMDETLHERPYAARLQQLLDRGVGLWDTVGSAVREGSLDGALQQVRTNPLHQLVGSLPSLQAVAFNGKTAARIGRSLLTGKQLTLIDLPSSSPAYTLPFAEKAERWAVLSAYVRRK